MCGRENPGTFIRRGLLMVFVGLGSLSFPDVGTVCFCCQAIGNTLQSRLVFATFMPERAFGLRRGKGIANSSVFEDSEFKKNVKYRGFRNMTAENLQYL